MGTPIGTQQPKNVLKENMSLHDVTLSSDNNGPFDPSRPSELVFRVKLTAEEYEMYLRERFTRMQNG